MHSLLVFFLPTALLSSLSAPAAAATPCTICSDGSPPQGQFGGIDCADFEADLAFTDANSPVCQQFQLQAYQFCSCPSYPEADFCPLCANGFYDVPNPQRPIVGWTNEKDGSWLTCDDVLFGDMSANGECERNSLAAYYCGCPEATATPLSSSSCSLCPEESEPIALEVLLENPNAPTPSPQILQLGRRVPPLFQVTCDDYRQAAAMFQQGDEYCETQIRGANLPIQLTDYCGCQVERAQSEVTCSLCPADVEVLTDEMTLSPADNKTMVSCAEWAVVAASVTDEAYCRQTIAAMQALCCEGMTTDSSGGATVPAPAPPTTTDAPPAEGGDEPGEKSQAFSSVVCSVVAGWVGAATVLIMWIY